MNTYLVYTPEQSPATLGAVAAFLAGDQLFVWEEHKKRFDDRGQLREYQFASHDRAKLGFISDANIWFTMLFDLPRLADDPGRKITCHALIPISNRDHKIKTAIRISDAIMTVTVITHLGKGCAYTSQVYEITQQPHW